MNGRKFLIVLMLVAACQRGYTAKEQAQKNENAPQQIETGAGETVMEELKDAKDAALTCGADFQNGRMKLAYEIANNGTRELYVLDTLATYDYETKQGKFEVKDIFVGWREPNSVRIFQGIAPLPPDRSVAVRNIPFGTKLPPKEKLARTLDIAVPFAEHSPYYPPVKTEDSEKTEVGRLLLTVQVLASSVEGFRAESVEGGQLFRARSKYLTIQVENTNCEITIPTTVLFKRKDNFVRF